MAKGNKVDSSGRNTDLDYKTVLVLIGIEMHFEWPKTERYFA
jgi:hypothetical protein